MSSDYLYLYELCVQIIMEARKITEAGGGAIRFVKAGGDPKEDEA